MKNLLTHSGQAAFKSCRRKYFYSYILGLRRIDDSKALRQGSAFHAGLEQLAKTEKHTLITPATCDCKKNDTHCNVCDGGLAICSVCKGGESDLDTACNLRLACTAVRKVYERCPEQFDEYLWRIEEETIVRLVCAYQWRWQNAPLEYVKAEHPFRFPLTNPATGAETPIWDEAGKIDGIVKLEDGRLAVLETKTTGESIALDGDYWRVLRMDQQISKYINAARREGFAVDTVLYNVVRKPTIEPTPVPILDGDGLKIVLDAKSERVRNLTGKKDWRQTGDKEKGYVLQTRPMTPSEWGEKLSNDIVERPDNYFARVEIPRLESDIADFLVEQWDVQLTIRDCQRKGKWFRTVSTHTCKFCSYFDICAEGREIEPHNLPLGFELVKNLHPELGEFNECTSTAQTAATATAKSTATAASTPGSIGHQFARNIE